MTKKILIITDNLQDQINGVVTTFKNMQALAASDGYDIVYIDPSKFCYCSAPGYPEVKLSWTWQIGAKIKAVDPDHVHIATEGPVGLAARIWLDWHDWRYNTSYHTKFPEFLNKLYHVPVSWTYAYVRWFHKHSGRVLTTTQTMVNDLRANGFTGDIVPWTRGVDRSVFRSQLRSRRQADGPILLSVGRVSKEKGLDDFCNLDIEGIKIVVGDGPYLEELRARYPKIMFTGAKTGKALAEHYANADVFVFTSRADTFGIVIIEAISVGTPVAAYPVSGPIDILENGITGHMSENLAASVAECLTYSRDRVESASNIWTWAACWDIFKNNLVDKSATR